MDDLQPIVQAILDKIPQGVRLRQGVIDHVNTDGTVALTIGGDTTVIDHVMVLASAYLSAGDTVWIATDGRDLWVIGRLKTPADGWHEVGSAGEPAFSNSWVNYDIAVFRAAAFCKDALGFVHLRGVIKTGTVGTVAFTLPAGYRPAILEELVCISNGTIGRIEVDGTGTVKPGTPSNSAWVALDGITFGAG